MIAPAKWIRFDPLPVPPSFKTGRWMVVAKDGDIALGEIRWYPQWRKYTFQPGPRGSIFEPTCLRDIAAFIDERMADRKEGRAEHRAQRVIRATSEERAKRES